MLAQGERPLFAIRLSLFAFWLLASRAIIRATQDEKELRGGQPVMLLALISGEKRRAKGEQRPSTHPILKSMPDAEPKSLMRRALEAAIRRAFTRAYKTIKVDPEKYMEHLRLAYGLPAITYAGSSESSCTSSITLRKKPFAPA